MTTTNAQSSRGDKKLRILIIDDDKQLLNALATTLSRKGFDVERAATGTEGLGHLQAGLFDLVLSDIELPDISGLEICQQIRKEPRWQKTPVILMSGRLAEDMAPLASSSGATDFISKPFLPRELITKLLAWVSTAQAAK
jgi:DNA-binding response OmpR family regulator